MTQPVAPFAAETESTPGEWRRPGGRRPRRWLLWALAAVLLLGAGLRFQHLTQPFVGAFAWRQASTAMIAENFYRTNANIFYPEVNWTGPGPGYQGREFQTVTYLAALLYRPFGQQDWVGRLVAILFGVWGIAALFLLVRRVWDEPRGLAAAALLSVIPGAIFVDRSFLPDPAMVALGTTSLWLFVVYLQENRLRFLLLAGSIGALAFMTKIPGLILGLPMLYAAVATWGLARFLRLERLAALVLFAFMTLGPTLAYYLWVRHLASTYPPNHFAGAGNWVWDGGLARWREEAFYLPRLVGRLRGWMWTEPVMAVAAIGIIAPPQRARVHERLVSRSRLPLPWLFHWWLVAGAIYILLGAEELVANPWNLHILTPPVAALGGNALVSIVSVLRGRQTLVANAIAGICCAALFAGILHVGQKRLKYLYHPYSQNSYVLGLSLREISEPGDLVVTLGDHHAEPTPIYYSRRRGWVFPPLLPGNQWTSLDTSDVRLVELLDSLRGEGARWLGLVADQYEDVSRRDTFGGHIAEVCTERRRTERYYICELRPPAGSVPPDGA